MSLFRKRAPEPEPLDPAFSLPPAPPRECTEFRLPSMNEMGMANLAWVEKQMAAGQPMDYWPTRILATAPVWRTLPVGSNLLTVETALDLEPEAPRSPESRDHLGDLATFGWLTGAFERSSGRMVDELCHPITWNALRFFLQSARSTDLEYPGAFEDKVAEAAYAMGRYPDLSQDRLFSRWR